MFFSLFERQPQNLDRVFREAMALRGQTNSGARVTSETALKISAVFSCVRVLSEDVGKTPLIVYQRQNKGRTRAVDFYLYDLLHNQPNEFQTSMAWRETMQRHACFRGNGYSFINRVSGGRIMELLPIHPDRCLPIMDENYNLTYEITYANGEKQVVPKENIFHLPGPSSNGYEGLSVLEHAREAIGLASATEKFGAQLFKNGAKHRGILKHPGTFSSGEVAKRVRESWDAATNGENTHGTAVLEDGMEWQAVGMTSEDSQFLETRKFQIADIARFFRVPLYKIAGDVGTAKGWSTLEQQSTDYLSDSLMPWFVRWEQGIASRLMTKEERKRYYAEFLFEGLLRADVKTRNEAYQIQRRNGIINANEWRERENMNPRTDPAGDEYIIEANMTTGGDNAPTV